MPTHAPNFLAHSANPDGITHDHHEHSKAVADLAAQYGTECGLPNVAWVLGLLHDAGKLTCAFQQRLAGSPVAVDHKTTGAAIAADHGLGVLAAPILGHHGGMPAFADIHGIITRPDMAHLIHEATTNFEADPRYIIPDDILAGAQKELARYQNDHLGAELAIRFSLSGLVDADYEDTEAHMNPRAAAQRRERRHLDMKELVDRFTIRRAKLLAGRRPSRFDSERNDVYERCIAAAARPPGLKRLTVPTGGGKTLSAMGYALSHAATHGKRRVVVAVPYLSITTQNAAVLRSVLDGPEPVVVEDHTGLDPGRDGRWAAKLASENWNSEVVITTTVRLFGVLLGNRPGAVRPLHRLANSVIVIDEIQTLPPHVLPAAIDIFQRLVRDYGCTIVFCSATQPDWTVFDEWSGGVPIEEIDSDAAGRFQRMRRVTYCPAGTKTLDEVGEWLSGRKQALVVVNTTADAASVHRSAQLMAPDGTFHLSARMAPAQRLWVLNEVRRRLASGEPCRLVSTQLIEAGVDVDFPEAMRAIGPAESHVQVGGRTNREGHLESAVVWTVDISDAGRLPGRDYALAVSRCERHVLSVGLDPETPGSLDAYWRDFYALATVGKNNKAGKLQKARRSLNFPETALLGALISDDTVPVVAVPEHPTQWCDAETLAHLHQTVEDLHDAETPCWESLDRLRPFMVSMHQRELNDAVAGGWAYPVIGDVHLWRAGLDETYGLLRLGPTNERDLIT